MHLLTGVQRTIVCVLALTTRPIIIVWYPAILALTTRPTIIVWYPAIRGKKIYYSMIPRTVRFVHSSATAAFIINNQNISKGLQAAAHDSSLTTCIQSSNQLHAKGISAYYICTLSHR